MQPFHLIMRCKECSYDLHGLVEHRCPECGRPFHPECPETFVTRLQSGRQMLFSQIGAMLAFVMPMIFWYVPGFRTNRYSAAYVFVTLVSIVAGFFLSIRILKASRRALDAGRGAVLEPWCLRAAYILSCIGVVVPSCGMALFAVLVILGAFLCRFKD